MTAYPGVAQIRKRPHRDARWQDHAACVDANPRIFFDPDRYADALLVCRECPVKAPCRELGRGVEGVWGGRIHRRKSKDST